jgi:hypothetical protein
MSEYDDWHEQLREWEEEDKAREDRKKQADSFPVMIKAKEVLALAETVAALWDDDPPTSSSLLKFGAQGIIDKIYEAEEEDYYSYRIEKAIEAKNAVRELQDHVMWIMHSPHPESKEYLDLFEPALEEFRVEFIEWIRGFNRFHDVEDDWQLPLRKY